jgi:hypothetical protein
MIKIVNDCRLKVDNANVQYRLQQKKTNQSHAEYYESHLPSVLRVRLPDPDFIYIYIYI